MPLHCAYRIGLANLHGESKYRVIGDAHCGAPTRERLQNGIRVSPRNNSLQRSADGNRVPEIGSALELILNDYPPGGLFLSFFSSPSLTSIFLTRRCNLRSSAFYSKRCRVRLKAREQARKFIRFGMDIAFLFILHGKPFLL